MTRSLTTAIKNELATDDIRPVHLITIGFGTAVNITDCSFPLTSSVSGSSVTYSSSDFILGVSNFTEETDVTKTSLTLTLSGADQTFISTCLNENVVNDSVDIFRGFLDDSNALIADPFLLYSGQIDTFSISEKGSDSTVALQIVSHWADFDKTNGRKTNNTSQQRFFSTDVGMDFSSQTVQDIKWGRA
tara:strand:+ start:1566 stop:2132 length:567 start_codon:yes stop_codon:yes gene_type:complete